MKMDLSKKVLQIRYWQHVVNEMLKKNALPVPVHMAFGHEAIAAANSAMMTDADQLALTHRNIAHNLARAGALQPVLDEYKRQASGLAGARLGSMNLSNPDRGVVYTSSILGNNMPVSCGLALAQKVKNQAGVVIVFTGDGAMEEGVFYESLVFAQTHHLKMLFMIENNNFSMSSTIPERRCAIDIERMAQAVQIPYVKLAGNDVADYYERLVQTRAQCAAQSGPVCVEVQVRNLYRHAGPTPGWPSDPMNIDLKRGLIVEETESDPLFVLKRSVNPEQYRDLEGQVLAETWSI